MAQIRYKTHYHIVWATSMRQPMIVPAIQQAVYGAIRQKAGELGCFIHAINGLEDHVHLAITIPPRLCVSTVIGQIKGFSTHSVNTNHKPPQGFEWQDGYGVETVSDFDLPRIIRYIDNQIEHHKHQTDTPGLENLGDEGIKQTK